MKQTDIILLSLAAGFFIIGVHQSFFFGISASYWLFMLSGGLMLWFKLRKDSQGMQPVDEDEPQEKSETNKKKEKIGKKK